MPLSNSFLSTSLALCSRSAAIFFASSLDALSLSSNVSVSHIKLSIPPIVCFFCVEKSSAERKSLSFSSDSSIASFNSLSVCAFERLSSFPNSIIVVFKVLFNLSSAASCELVATSHATIAAVAAASIGLANTSAFKALPSAYTRTVKAL